MTEGFGPGRETGKQPPPTSFAEAARNTSVNSSHKGGGVYGCGGRARGRWWRQILVMVWFSPGRPARPPRQKRRKYEADTPLEVPHWFIKQCNTFFTPPFLFFHRVSCGEPLLNQCLLQICLSAALARTADILPLVAAAGQVSMIEKAMRDVHFSTHPTRSAKQQVRSFFSRAGACVLI